jgi:AhpD family alkylhydroperoxidase
MERSRVGLAESAPDLYRAMVQLDRLTNERVTSAGIDEGFSHMLRLRASQLNGCAFCVRMHARDALAAGESTDRVSVLPAWRETAYFDEKERAALALVEAVTLISDGQVPDEVYSAATDVLSEDEILAVEWLGVAINGWNRIAIPSRTPVGP